MRFLVYALLIMLAIPTWSQSSFESGFLPKVILSKKYSQRLTWVNSIESRTDVYGRGWTFNHNLVDISSILSVKTDPYQTFNLGYILRLRGGEIIHRSFQHYNIIQNLESGRLGHRFALEQFFDPSLPFYLRGRYQLQWQRPLNGQRVDLNEFYLKLGNEYLWNFRNQELELRLTPYLGYQLSANDRIEFGLDYRTVKFEENNLWIRTTWYISL